MTKTHLLRMLVDRFGGSVVSPVLWQYGTDIFVQSTDSNFRVHIFGYEAVPCKDIQDVMRRLVRYGLLNDAEGKITR